MEGILGALLSKFNVLHKENEAQGSSFGPNLHSKIAMGLVLGHKCLSFFRSTSISTASFLANLEFCWKGLWFIF